MKEIARIRSLSLWIFLIPIIAINVCLFIAVNYNIFENTIFTVDQIGRSNFTIPYLDGGTSISRVSRTFPQYLIFKPSMILTGLLLMFYWNYNNSLVNKLKNTENYKYRFRVFGILSAIFLIIHSIFLGIKFDYQIYKLFRRVVLVLFIVFEVTAQFYLIRIFIQNKEKIKNLVNLKILLLKKVLVYTLIIVAILILPFLPFNNLKKPNLLGSL